MMHYYGMMGYGWIFQLLIFVLFFAVVWWMLKSSSKSESAKEILDKRLAKGEIDSKEYKKLKKEIE